MANRSGVDDRDSPVVATERWADALNKPGSVQVMVVNMLGLTGESATRPCRPMGRKGGLSRMGRGDAYDMPHCGVDAESLSVVDILISRHTAIN